MAFPLSLLNFVRNRAEARSHRANLAPNCNQISATTKSNTTSPIDDALAFVW